MSRKSAVIGQTGSVVLSDNLIQYKGSKKRTVRFQYERMKCGWIAWVCGPFHSRTYGACGYGATKSRAKEVLQRNLANHYRYFGRLMFSVLDSSDTVGIVVT